MSVRILIFALPLFLAAPAARAACVVTLKTPSSGAVLTESPWFTWNGGCAQYRVQFSVDGTFVGQVTSSQWLTVKSYKREDGLWRSRQAGPWAAGAWWRVQGLDAAGARTDTASRPFTMDPDLDVDGVSVAEGDCDDGDPTVYPGAAEECDGLDQDCDGAVDEGFDQDGDLYRTCDGDCDDTDAAAHPGAVETCDAVDNDCDGAVDEDLEGCVIPATEVQGVVLIVVDTLRADRIGCAAPVGLAPTMEALFQSGTCFAQARQAGSWTGPGTTSILSGVHPPTHTILHAVGNELPDSVELLPDLLGDEGFGSAILVSNQNARGRGLGDRYDYDFSPDLYADLSDAELDVSLVANTDDALAALGADLGNRFFLHYQFMSPHSPYCPPTDPVTMVEGVDFCFDATFELTGERVIAGNEVLLDATNRLYDAEVSYVDTVIQALLDVFAAEGLLDRILVVVTSDHGEALGDHDEWGHGQSVYQSMLDVPLGFFGPGVPAGGVSTDMVSVVDIAPTVLDVLGFDGDSQFEGRSLLGLIEMPEADWGPPRSVAVSSGVDMVHLFAISAPNTEGELWTLHGDVDAEVYRMFKDGWGNDTTQSTDRKSTIPGAAMMRFLTPMVETPVVPYDEWADEFYGG